MSCTSINRDRVTDCPHGANGIHPLSRVFATLPIWSLLAIGAILRIAFLTQDMRYDEAQTFNLYVSQAPNELFHFSKLNNHLFHSLVVWGTTLFVGTEPWALRLPAFVAGLLAIYLTFRLCRELNEERGGILAASAMVVFPFLVLFSTNARGYTMLMCFVLLLAININRLVRKTSSVSNLKIALLTAFGLWTNPSMLYPIAALLLWLFLELYTTQKSAKHVTLRFVIPILFQIYAFTMLLYAPTLLRDGGFDDLLNNRVTRSLPVDEFTSGIVTHVQKVIRHLTRDVPSLILWSLSLFFGIGAIQMIRKKTGSGATFLIAMLVGVGGLFLLKRSFPFTRNWMFLIPIFLIHADIGFTWLVDRLPAPMRPGLLAVVLIPFLFMGYDLVDRDAISRYNDTGRFPEVVEVSEFLAAHITAHDEVVAQVPDCEPLTYYLRKHQLSPKIRRRPEASTRTFVVVREGSSRNSTVSEGLTPVFHTGKATVYITESASLNMASRQPNLQLPATLPE